MARFWLGVLVWGIFYIPAFMVFGLRWYEGLTLGFCSILVRNILEAIDRGGAKA